MGISIAGLCKGTVRKGGRVKDKEGDSHRMKKNMGFKGNMVWAAIAAALLTGCGQADGNDAVAAQSESVVTSTPQAAEEEAPAEAKSVEEIYNEITQSVELISPVPMGDNFITNYYGIDPEKLEEYVFVMSEEATSAETVVIMKVKDEGDVEAMCKALQVVVDEKRSEMQDYLPEQFEIVDKSSVKSSGSYAYLVISEQADAILQIIEKEL